MPVNKSDSISLPFNVGDSVVYPLQGVGNIKSIEKRKFKNKEIDYYNIYIPASDMTIMVPTEKILDLAIRSVVKPDVSKKVLKLLSSKSEPLTTDWKQRYQLSLDLLKKGGLKDLAIVVQNLYHRSKVKELPTLERKLFDGALRSMIDEIAISLNRDKNDIEETILSKLESTPEE